LEPTILTYVTMFINIRSFPTFSLPSALDIHLSPVTCVQYCSKCPEELIASLQSVNSKLTAENKSTKVYLCMYFSFVFVWGGRTYTNVFFHLSHGHWKVESGMRRCTKCPQTSSSLG